MKCIGVNDVTRYLAGKLSPDKAELMEGHFDRCDACAGIRDELQRAINRLAPSPSEFDDPELVNDVMALIRLKRAGYDSNEGLRSKLKSRLAWFLIPVTAIATAAIIIRVRPVQETEQTHTVQSRGSYDNNLNKWVSLQIYQQTIEGYREVDHGFVSGSALAFSYLNRSENRLKYLMILGVDSQGEVFWYYPNLDDATRDTSSIAIRTDQRSIALPEQISHRPHPGPFRVFGVFSPEPLQVSAVEATVNEDFSAAQRIETMSRLSINNIGQHSILLQVRDSVSQGKTR